MASRNNLALSKQVMDIAEPMIRRKGTFFGLPKSSIHAAVSSIVLALEKKDDNHPAICCRIEQGGAGSQEGENYQVETSACRKGSQLLKKVKIGSQHSCWFLCSYDGTKRICAMLQHIMYGKSNHFYLLKMEYVSKFTITAGLFAAMMALSEFVQCLNT